MRDRQITAGQRSLSRPRLGLRGGGGMPPALLLAVLVIGGLIPWAVWIGRPAVIAQEAADDDEDSDERGVYLPVDRVSERRLAVARRQIADARWSDAAALLDELMAADRDSFFRKDLDAATWQSVKVEAGHLIATLPPEGRRAYEIQFRARAERLLTEAVESGDSHAIAAVARRWLNTPAGQQATLLAAIEALDDGQPLASAAWLDRLHEAVGDRLEPTLSIMRAVAWQRAGDAAHAASILDVARAGRTTTARIGGRDVSVSFAPGKGLEWLAGLVGQPPAGSAPAAADWTMHRGDPSRNAVADASRPLLVPRYRVPLTRHPEEAKWLEARRKRGADRDRPLLPAATPLAVDGTIIVHAPMGLLAVDFETGKRRWLQTGGAAAQVTDAAVEDGPEDGPVKAVDFFLRRTLAPVFEDATSGTLASDGHLVFAVESHPDALGSREAADPQMRVIGGGDAVVGGWNGGNTLAAYDLADDGRLRWRLPTTSRGRDGGPPVWKLGPPLPVGGRLFLLVEEQGEVRLDVVDAEAGSVLWTQPLAELDEQTRVDTRENQPRRVSGLTPALAEGVLVCPTGAGAVVAVDLATRTLLWAYHYRVAAPGDVVAMQNGIRMAAPGRIVGGRMVIQQAAGDGAAGTDRWLDSCPVIAGGRVILTPCEADELHCLDLRTGKIAWKRPRHDGLYVAGVADRRLILVGRRGVEAVSMDTGDALWTTPLAVDGAAIGGRAVLATGRLFVPLDSPEVVEIEIATGAIAGRSRGRGGSVPGNLVAYRGELLSQAADSLDVFHQVAPLETRIETAQANGPSVGDEAWRLMWSGQIQLDRGAVADGIAALRAARSIAPDRFPPDVLAEALVFAMERDGSAAGSLWADLVGLRPGTILMGRGLRVAIDGLLRTGDFSSAWQACRCLLELPAGEATATDALVADGSDQHLRLSESRWIQARLADLHARAPAEIRRDIDAFAAASLGSIRTVADEPGRGDGRAAALESFVERFGRHPAAIEARRELADCLGTAIAGERSDGDAARSLEVRRDFVFLDLLHGGAAADRTAAGAALASARGDLAAAPPVSISESWPLGRVAVKRVQVPPNRDGNRARTNRTFPLSVEAGEDALLPGARFEFDMQHGGLIVSDGLGRRLGGPITIDKTRPFMLGGFNPAMADVTVIGRVAVLRSGGFAAAYELAGMPALGTGGAHRRLWVSEGSPSARPSTGTWLADRRFPRSGSIPLGMPIPEPEAGGKIAAMMSVPQSPARVTGVPMLVDGSVQVLDPATGELLWERRRVSDAVAVFGDDDVLCICPSNGRGATVVSMATGRVIRTADLPDREHRLLTHGRCIVSVARRSTVPSGRNIADTVGLEIIDPFDMQRWQLGEFSGEARATMAGGELAILEPSGRLTIVDLAGRRVAVVTQLPEMPSRLERLEVVPWQDRYLVIAGRPETDAERQHLERVGTINPLPQLSASGQPLTGSIWAVDRLDGEMLWPVPATILRHCLHPAQSSQLPILLFARQIETRRGGERPRLSVLCLDKRTGHAVHVDDTILAQTHLLFSCDAVGDPGRHTISILPVGVGAVELEMEFTGEPVAPQPPFQATSRPVVAGDLGTELEYWWQRLLTLPLPF